MNLKNSIRYEPSDLFLDKSTHEIAIFLILDALSSEFQEVAEFIDNNDDKKDSVILGWRPIFWSVSPAVVYSIPLPRFILSSIETDD